MAADTRELDLASLRLSPGEGRRLQLHAPIDSLLLGSERYLARAPEAVPANGAHPPADPGRGPAARRRREAAGEAGVQSASVPVDLDVSRMTGGGYALRLRFSAAAVGPCMRCLEQASPEVHVEAREVDVPGGGEELDSPYVHDETLELSSWAHDALALAMPTKVLCREDCAGLCPVCAATINEAGPEHHHEAAPDPRWAKLRELKIG